MTESREIMAAAIRSVKPEGVYADNNFKPFLLEADACLAALTAAGFEVRRRMYVAHGDGITDDTEAMQAALDGREVRRREKLRERIADVIWKSDAFVDGRFDAERLADDVLAVLDGQEP